MIGDKRIASFVGGIVLLLAAFLLIPARTHAAEMELYSGLAKNPVPLYQESNQDWFGPIYGIRISGSAMESFLHAGLDVRYQTLDDTQPTLFQDVTYTYSLLAIAPTIAFRTTREEYPTTPFLEAGLGFGALRYGINYLDGRYNDGSRGEDEVRWYPILRPGISLKIPMSSSARLFLGMDGTFLVNKPDDRMPADHTSVRAGFEFAL